MLHISQRRVVSNQWQKHFLRRDWWEGGLEIFYIVVMYVDDREGGKVKTVNDNTA